MNITFKRLVSLIIYGLLTVILIIFAHSVYAQENVNSVKTIDGVPVVLGSEELFTIQTQIGSFSPQDRANVITERVQSIALEITADVESFDIEKNENLTNIIFNTRVIVTITEKDAKAARLSQQELAESYVNILRKSIIKYRQERRPDYLIRSGIYTLLCTLAMVIFLFILAKIFPKIFSFIEENKGRKIKAVKLQNLEIIPANKLGDILIDAFKLIHWLIIFITIYVYLPFALSFFPWTKRLSDSIFAQINKTISVVFKEFIDYLPNLFTIITIIVITYYILRFFKLIFTELREGNLSFPGFYQEWAEPTYKLLLFTTISLAAVIAFPYLPGFDSPAFQGISLFIGVLFSLGSTAVVANIVAGIILIYTRAFQVGDRVKMSSTIGDVVEKTLFVTRIRTTKNVIITIPNAMVLDSHMINYSASVIDANKPLILHTTITLGYDVPWRKVHQVLIDAAMMTENTISNPPPFVLQTSLDDFYVSYELNVYTDKSILMSSIYSQLHQNIQDKCNEADIEILSPHYSAVRDGHHTTIPEEYLPSDYEAPSFRINPLERIFNKKQSSDKK